MPISSISKPVAWHNNSTISGETIDYGPCAFMNGYDLNTVYSSIDLQGRYSYGNQPNIIHWNILRLAESLIGLIDDIFDISPFPRLSVQILFSFLIYASGISFFKIDDSFIFADNINLLSTIVWIVGITNAMNWFDGLDGLASGVSIITLSSFALIFFVNHSYLYAPSPIHL